VSPPPSLCREKDGYLVAGGALGGDVTWLLKCAPEEVAMSALLWAICAPFGQRARATLGSLAVNLRFTTAWGLSARRCPVLSQL
jgi:hypothetical protein